jgi:hypothetical protein
MLQDLASIQSRLKTAIENIRQKHESFDEAYRSYTGQYGEGSVKAYDPCKISGTIDPVIIVLGRTTTLFYRDSKRLLSGSQNSITLESENVYILGRRQRLDSKLVVWSQKDEVEIEQFDSRVRVVPSRIHGSILQLGNEVYFTDLGSSSGSIVAGETQKPEPFITLYATPSVELHKVTLDGKYAPTKGK